MSLNSKNLINRILGFSLATWVNCLITFISTPIVTALFVPEELGKVNLFVTCANVITPFVYIGFDQAFARFYHEPPSKNTAHSLGRICLLFSTSFFLIASAVIFVIRNYISGKIVGYYFGPIVISLMAFVFAEYIMRYTQLNARMQNKVLQYSIQSIISTFVIKISFVLVVLIRPSAEYAIMLRSACYLLTAVIFVTLFLRQGRNEKMYIDKETCSELSKFAVPLFPTHFLVALNNSLPMFMLSKYAGYSDIGIYSNAVTIASIVTVVQSGLTVFWTPFVYEYYKTEKRKLQLMHHVISICVIGFGFLLILCQYPIYKILVAQQYWQSREIFALLVLSPVCYTISETLGIGIDLVKKTYLKMPVYAINIAANFLASILLVPRYGVFGAAMATAAASLVMLITKACLGNKYYRCSDNYLKLVFGISTLICAGLVNMFISGTIKYYIIGALMVLCMAIYKREIKIVIREGKNYLTEFINHRREK